jgi:hypothetical protein
LQSSGGAKACICLARHATTPSWPRQATGIVWHRMVLQTGCRANNIPLKPQLNHNIPQLSDLSVT